ncbi:MAG: hypothetical protein ACI9QL_003742 [Candidatus Omnitrophota bacterium]|jgi:hypothetical protein
MGGVSRSLTGRAFFLLALFPLAAFAGPYSQAIGDASNGFDPPVPGYIGPDGPGVISVANGLNPAFVAWADRVIQYTPADQVDAGFDNPQLALGPVTGDQFDIVSLGDRDVNALNAGALPGMITLGFPIAIANLPGPDFAVFENAFSVSPGDTFAELAFVEVSTDGTNFVRFPAVSETASPVIFADPGIDVTGVYNLAGKHVNHDLADTWGTPFDLEQLRDDPAVQGGLLDVLNVRYVRIVDIPGSGFFADRHGHPIYDLWPSQGSGGFDLEAVGVLNPRVTCTLSDDGTQLSFVAPPQRRVTLQGCMDLLNPAWNDVSTMPGDGLGHTVPVSGYRYYRLALDLP